MTDKPQESQELLGIQQVADQTGISPSTIRYYDQQFGDYLGVERGAGRRRLFSAGAVERLLEVQRLLKTEGLSLRQARQVISGGESPVAAAEGADLGELKAQVAALKGEVGELRAQVTELREIQKRTLALVSGLTRG